MSPTFDIHAPDDALDAQIERAIDEKTKPPGSLGRLESLAAKLCRLQRTVQPTVSDPVILLFAADHGIATEGVSAFPQAVTRQMVANFLAGGAAINVFARLHDVRVRVVDAGVAHDFGAEPGLVDAKIAHGTANFLHQPAMTPTQRDTALARGVELARECARGGSNVLGCGEMGIGNTSAAAMLLHRVGDLPLEVCVGPGTGLDDAGVARKRSILAAASRRCTGQLASLDALAEYGGFEIAMMVGAFLGAAEAGMLVLVDGFIATSALLIAARLQPAVLSYCVFAHASAEPGHRLALELLHACPLLELDMRLGEGTGAVLAVPLLRSAAAFVAEMASFRSAAVSDRVDGKQ